jgi:hypothetical protein
MPAKEYAFIFILFGELKLTNPLVEFSFLLFVAGKPLLELS